jgi:hypothetical protein
MAMSHILPSLVLAILFCGLTPNGVLRAGQQPASPPSSDPYAKLADSIQRLESQSPGSTRDLDRRLQALRSPRGGTCARDEICADLWESVTEQARTMKIVSHVTVATSKGTGARVRYQTLKARLSGPDHEVRDMKRLSIVQEDIEIGSYYMWSERNGAATSSKDRWFEVVRPKEDPITLEEH